VGKKEGKMGKVAGWKVRGKVGGAECGGGNIVTGF